MSEVLEFVFKKLKVKSLELENRISMPSMHLNFTKDGYITEEFIAFYRERAKGDVGLITIGGCAIDDTAGGGALIGIYDDKFLDGLKRFSDTIHSNSKTKIAAQLYHAGRYAFSLFIGKQPVAPSPIPSKLTKETPRELTIEEIKNIEDDFAEAAARAKRAGFDAVELLFSAGYLVSQFLSPLTNKREDEYGGSLENRARFGVEVIKKVREAVGEGFPVIIRQSGSDFVRGSNTSLDILEAVKIFAEAGVDIINVTGGWHETHVPQIAGATPRGAFSYLAFGIKKATGKPVMASNRIPTLELAEEFLRDGWADIINMGRPLIADPYLVKKHKEGYPIRPCIACNQMCFDAVFTGKKVGCTVNPYAGREAKYVENEIKKTDNIIKKIAVIGAGPAGMSAAITLARRGHNVIVLEKSNKIGGKLFAASAPYDKSEFRRLIDYYEAAASSLHVRIILGVDDVVKEIESINPDEVVVATGSEPLMLPVENDGFDNVVYAEEVLLGKVQLKDNIVIVGGGAVGVDVALYIIEHSQINGEQAKFLLKWEAETPDRVKELTTSIFRNITIIEMDDAIGKDIGKTTRWISLKELAMSKVNMMTNTKVIRITENGVVVKKGEEEFEIETDMIVIAVGYKPNNSFVEFIKDKVRNVHFIGDAKKVGKLPEAIRDGFEIGLEL